MNMKFILSLSHIHHLGAANTYQCTKSTDENSSQFAKTTVPCSSMKLFRLKKIKYERFKDLTFDMKRDSGLRATDRKISFFFKNVFDTHLVGFSEDMHPKKKDT